jgi:hypothetical protein
MMAKMFYTLEEAKVALGRNEEEIKQLSREGRLREFRDGPRLMFKADQVDTLKSELGGGGGPGEHPDLGPSDTGAPIGLADSLSASAIGSGLGSGLGSGIGSGSIGSGMGSLGGGISLAGTSSGLSLADSEAHGGSKAGSIGGSLGGSMGGGSRSNTGGVAPLGLTDDADLSADLGLSGSLGGIPSPGKAGSGSGLSGLSGIGSGGASGAGSPGAGSGTGSRSGINVLSSDDSSADPMAQTSISSGISDQVGSDSVGSGSGLLDLTRESDDTSLGAELLDEISPAAGRRPATAGDSSLAGVTAGGVSAGRRGISMPQQQETPDALAPAFGGAALAAAVFVLYGTVILCSSVLHTKPGLADLLSGKSFAIVAGVGAGLAIVFFIVGLFIGKTTTR